MNYELQLAGYFLGGNEMEKMRRKTFDVPKKGGFGFDNFFQVDKLKGIRR